MNTAIITDTSSTFSKKDLEKYSDLYLIPLNLVLPDGESVADDQNQLSDEKFYNLLEYAPIKTSQASIGQMMELWTELLKKYEYVVFLGLSKGLSGQYNTTAMMAKNEQFNGRVLIIDTDGVTEILQHMVLFAYKYLEEGNDINNLQSEINKLKLKYTAFIVPKNLTSLCRGGRILPAVAKLANLLKIIPILTCDGQIDKFDKTRTFNKAVLIALTELKKIRKTDEVILVWARVDLETQGIVSNLAKKVGFQTIIEYQMPRAIAAHTGGGTVGLICWDKE